MRNSRRINRKEAFWDYLLIQGILLTLLAVTHIAAAIASLLVNAANIYYRRSALPLILVIITLPLLATALVNTFYFDSAKPFIWMCLSVPPSAALALLIQCVRIRRK